MLEDVPRKSPIMSNATDGKAVPIPNLLFVASHVKAFDPLPASVVIVEVVLKYGTWLTTPDSAAAPVPVIVTLPPFALVDSEIDNVPATLMVTGLPPDVLVSKVDELAPPEPTPKIPSFAVFPSISVEVIVKLGYVPVTTEMPAPVIDTVWSGEVLLIVHWPDELETPIPVPAMRFQTGKVTDENGTPSFNSDARNTPETMSNVSSLCSSLVNDVSTAEMVSPEITMPGPAT